MKIELVQNEDLTVKTKTGSTVTVPSPAADDTLATMADATLTDVSVYTDWVCDPAVSPINGYTIVAVASTSQPTMHLSVVDPSTGALQQITNEKEISSSTTSVTWEGGIESQFAVVATRTVLSGYQLGSQTGKPLQPAGNYARKTDLPSLPLSIANGGTGATTAAAARASLGAVSRTGDDGLTGDYTITGSVRAGGVISDAEISAGNPQAQQPGSFVVIAKEGVIVPFNGTATTPVAIPGGKQATDPTNTLPVLATDAQHNLLDYTSGTTLAPQTAVYRFSADINGTSASIPSLTYTGIPTSASYYCFELEMYVLDTATSLTGPTTSSDPPWIWIPGGELPTYGYAGKTVFIACRMDCASRKVMANCYLVGDSIKVDPVGMETLALVAGVTPTDSTTVNGIQAKLGLSDANTIQDAANAVS